MRLRCFVVASLAAILSSAHGMLSARERTELLDSARVFVDNAQRLLRARTLAGIDRRPEDFERVEAAIFEGSPPEAQSISRLSQMINFIDNRIRKNSLKTTVKQELSSTKSGGSLYCPFEPPTRCALSKYRTLDGTCNNVKYPLRGAALTPLVRFLRPVYQQGNGDNAFNLPRTQGKTRPLPSAREVSRTVHQATPNQKARHNVSVFFTFWGQFLAHMITDRALGAGFNGSKVDCCSQRRPTPRGECFNIPIANNDPFRRLGTTCLGFLRSLEVTDVNCNGGRQQLNVASSYIDGSAVYGVEKERAEFLRTHEDGLLAVSEPNQLPYREHVNAIAARSGFSFVTAGDPRAAEVAPLTGVHTIWVREHNRIARGLKAVNPRWNDERLYQEARRIIVAMTQHVTYNEWLPLLLGSKLYRRFGLQPKTSGFSTDYSQTVDASTSNVVATAAFRFGHSLVPDAFPLCNKRYQNTSPAVSIVDVFYRPNLYLMNEQGLMRCLLARRAPAMDASLSSPLTSQLFQINQPHGLDLAALNIQRGRDHGLPSYNAWRRSMRLAPSTRFSSGTRGFTDIPEDTVRRLQSVYSDPDDVDVWTGGVSETPLGGAVLGPLFGNILARQFQRYKRGDRYWYETSLKPQAFTADQLRQIRRTRFSRVICNTYDVDIIQPSAFRVHTASRNSHVRCNQLPQIDLRFWKS